MQPLIEIKEVARLLGRAVQTLRNDLLRNPAAVPPRVRFPGSNALRWRIEDVEKWVAQYVEMPPEYKRGRGRPRKMMPVT